VPSQNVIKARGGYALNMISRVCKHILVRKVLLLGMDIVLIHIAALLALDIRFDFQMANQHIMYRTIFLENSILYSVIVIGTLYFFGLYRSLWRYASIHEMMSIALAAFWSNIIIYIAYTGFSIVLPRSFYVVNMFTLSATIGGIRFSYRILRRLKMDTNGANKSCEKKERVLIIGAGEAGVLTAKELLKSYHLNKIPVAFLDDDIHKRGKFINGIPVIDKIDEVAKIVYKMDINEIIFALPSVNMKRKKEVLESCKELGVKMRILPGIYEIIDGRVDIKQIRDVQIEDLLGREPIKLENPQIQQYIENKVVLVTGGGGSIGSELCRQIAKYNPKTLVIFDIYENTTYDIQNELLKRYGKGIDLQVLIGSVRDKERLKEVFESYNPHIVFHAAAHKHVPLMQNSPFEAIKNNTLGTFYTAQTAGEYNVERFVLISTDKAVNPTNIMGASKRLAELVIQTMNIAYSRTEFVAVRFGNVLGSNGSVIPLFKKQIEQGGPVTVTHPDIIRYFMTIPEAVQLVLQTGSIAKGGEIFILDMGEPVKIVDLAKDLIRLSGFEPEEEIKIQFTGLRPGEKLFEELLLEEEGISDTVHEKIFIGKPLYFSLEKVEEVLEGLKQAIEEKNLEKLEQQVKSLVPHYRCKEK
jgi:FlaA1/EpsC-like NDP-sugar epimerase